MPHATVKLAPGADQNQTPVLNTASFSQTDMVRFIYDREQGALVQKIGGWTAYTSLTTGSIVRALHAWEDTNAQSHLAYGTQNNGGVSNLSVITNGAVKNITPRNTLGASITPAASSTVGSSLITITDTTTTGITNYDSVYIANPIAIGGIVLFGLYPCDPNGYIGTDTYKIKSVDILGNEVNATSTSTSPVVAQLAVTSGSPNVTVTLPAHGYSVGSTFTILTPTTIGGVTFYGQYLVKTVVDANNFIINPTTTASSTQTAYLNAGNASYIYNFGVGTIPKGTGYGVGGYGAGGYGSGTSVTPGTGTAISATDWVFDNYGENILAVAQNESIPAFQPIYAWNPISGSPTATIIPQAPAVNDGCFVAMPQRQIIAWGSSFNGIQDPLLIRWSDIGNYNSWIGQITNQAGSYRLPKGSKIIGCIQAPQQGLIWTDVGVWSMQYIGQPYVYSFNELGSGCGMIARKAAGVLNGIVYWMGPSMFYALTGNGVTPIACPIWDVIFQDLDQSNLQKIRVAVNSRFGEITWYYPTLASGGEIGGYVKYSPLIANGVWDFGTLQRTAWIDQSVLGPPIGADPNSLLLMQHETSADANGSPILSSFQTGDFSIADGDSMMFVDQVWPDMKWGYYGGSQNATVNITFNVSNYPGDTPQTYGPYALTKSVQYISPRFRGRLVSLTVSSNDIGSFWRMGGLRYRFSPDGKF